MPHVCFASDVVVLTSDNEGTPVSLIEAKAAAVPVVGTDVGGVRVAVMDRETGMLEPPDDEPALASAVDEIDQNLRCPHAGARPARARPDVAIIGSSGMPIARNSPVPSA